MSGYWLPGQQQMELVFSDVRRRESCPSQTFSSQHLCGGPGPGTASLSLHPASTCCSLQNFLPGLVGGLPLLNRRIALGLLDYRHEAAKQGESCNKVSDARCPSGSRCLYWDQLPPPRVNYRATVEGTAGESAENTDSGHTFRDLAVLG